MNDDEIISLFEARKEYGIQALSEKYHAYCYKIDWNLLTNNEDTEECLNDTWFTVWSLIPPKRPAVLSHFCGKITRNLSIDRLRKKYAYRRPDAHQTDILGEMDAKDRDIFVRRYWFLDSVSAISKRHGMSVGSVKMNLYRSRKKLLKVLKKEGRYS